MFKLIDSRIGAEFQLEFERIFDHIDGRKQPPAAKHFIEISLIIQTTFIYENICLMFNDFSNFVKIFLVL